MQNVYGTLQTGYTLIGECNKFIGQDFIRLVQIVTIYMQFNSTSFPKMMQESQKKTKNKQTNKQTNKQQQQQNNPNIR